MLAKNLAAAAIRYAHITSHQLKFAEMNRLREAQLIGKNRIGRTTQARG